jgi:hypothetical protein
VTYPLLSCKVAMMAQDRSGSRSQSELDRSVPPSTSEGVEDEGQSAEEGVDGNEKVAPVPAKVTPKSINGCGFSAMTQMMHTLYMLKGFRGLYQGVEWHLLNTSMKSAVSMVLRERFVSLLSAHGHGPGPASPVNHHVR